MDKPLADADDVYDHTIDDIRISIIESFRAVPGDAQVVYILGSDWRIFDIIEDLEAALDVPVLHPVVVRCWYILTVLGRTAPMTGHGRLLATMPPFAG